MIAALAAQAQVVLTSLHSFGIETNGGNPEAALVQGSDGYFYGTTENGGTNGGWGTVFRTSATGALTTLHCFGVNDGANPVAGLVQGSDGYFYGTTENGGTNGSNGTVFRISPTGTLTSLYSFGGGNDGRNPEAALVQGTDGNFYGTTYGVPGATNYGTVFKISASGTFTSLHSFAISDGEHPEAALVQGTDGNFYGTTAYGGPYSLGTVFRISASGAFTNLYSFSGGSDGAGPKAALVQGTDGNFYGTTTGGGSYGLGTVFKIGVSGIVTSLYSFTGGNDGINPTTALVQGSDGSFYGTTAYGGPYSLGTVFRISPTGAFTDLRYFIGGNGGNNGGNPEAGLVQGSDGYFYGTTYYGGTTDNGTVFKISAGGGVFTSLFSFTGRDDGAYPEAGLVQGSDGYFYGTTPGGGTDDDGTIFRVSASGAFASLYSFTNGNDGEHPRAGLAQGSDGYFYGTTSGGFDKYGTVFKISASGVFTSLYSFTNGNDGANVNGGLVQASDGCFYGATSGGFGKYGTVFKITASGAFTSLYSFTNGNDGAYPEAALVQGSDGNFYGTTYGGGTHNAGTVFMISASRAFTSLYSFAGGIGGAYPEAGLVQGSDGYFYGTTYAGGTNGYGTVFKISLGGALTSLYSFPGGDDGAYPYASLVQGGDGNHYGTTTGGGANDSGTIFKISASGVLTALYSFAGGNDGRNPQAGLVEGSDGNFYGTTAYGGIGGNGTVFRLSVGPPIPPVIETADGHFGVRNNALGFNITGASNSVVVVEATASLAGSPFWTPVWTNTLVGGTACFSDSTWTNCPARFYRVRTQ